MNRLYEQNLGGPYSVVRLVGQLHSAQLSQLPSVPETRRRPEGHTGPRVPLRGREMRGGAGPGSVSSTAATDIPGQAGQTRIQNQRKFGRRLVPDTRGRLRKA